MSGLKEQKVLDGVLDEILEKRKRGESGVCCFPASLDFILGGKLFPEWYEIFLGLIFVFLMNEDHF